MDHRLIIYSFISIVIIIVIIIQLINSNILYKKRNNYYSIAPIKNRSSKTVIKLANHLKEKKVILYAMSYCYYCRKHKSILGREACKIIEIKEPPDNITAIPAWNIDNKIYYGYHSIRELMEISEFPKL